MLRWHSIYLHGFNSSEQSAKAVEWRGFLAVAAPDAQCHIPRLAPTPQAALAQIRALLSSLPEAEPVTLMGSSMGGFFTAYFSELLGLPGVLINPAVTPHRLLKDYLGYQQNPYTGQGYWLQPEHMATLQALQWQGHHPELLQVWLQTGDETLDYREAAARFADCECHISAGGDHRYQHFRAICPAILAFMKQQLADLNTYTG